MIEFGLNDKLMDIDASFKENRIDFALAGLSFTLLHNNNPVCSGGIVPLWNGVAEGWVIATSEMWKHPLSVAKAIKKDFARVAKENNITRVQSAIRKDFSEGLALREPFLSTSPSRSKKLRQKRCERRLRLTWLTVDTQATPKTVNQLIN